MRRPIRVLLVVSGSVALAVSASACGTEKIKVSPSDPTYSGAVLFSKRCSGCHTLSYAATRGSASNVRTREITNGPNFDVRCERPITRVLYAIENGGFSGAIMPQNVVVGPDAIKVAEFVATYAGRHAATQPGATPCVNQAIGTIPAPGAVPAAPSATNTTAAGTAPGTPPSAQVKRAKKGPGGAVATTGGNKKPARR